MKPHAARSNGQFVARHQHGQSQYSKVFDQRKRRIRGLWERNGAFYAQLTVTDENTGKKIVRRMRMEDADGNPVPTAAEAVKAMSRLKVEREDNVLSLTPKRAPSLAEYSQQYLAHCEALKNKTKGTIHRERSCINNLNRAMRGALGLVGIPRPDKVVAPAAHVQRAVDYSNSLPGHKEPMIRAKCLDGSKACAVLEVHWAFHLQRLLERLKLDEGAELAKDYIRCHLLSTELQRQAGKEHCWSVEHPARTLCGEEWSCRDINEYYAGLPED